MLTLALGIGVNVAVYSLYDVILLRQLPVVDPSQLVNFVPDGPKPGNNTCNNQGPCTQIFSYPMFRDLERAPGLVAGDGPFAGIAGSRLVPANLGYAGQTIPTEAVLASGSYFSVLGLAPALGRLLGPQDDAVDGAGSVVVLSHDYWTHTLGADPGVLGKTLVVNGKPLEIVGVAPRGFRGTAVGARPQVYAPITFRWQSDTNQLPNFDSRRDYWVYMFGRLKPGVSLDQAQAAINVPYRAILGEVEAPTITQLTAADLERFRTQTIAFEPGARGQSAMPGAARTPLTVLLLATAVVLLIACVNLTNLMLARGAARASEINVRAALGAAQTRLLLLFVVEALLLAAAAAVASLPIAFATLEGIKRLMGSNGAESGPDFGLDAHALAAAFAIASLAAVAFALVPMLKLVRTDPARALQASGARSFGGKGIGRFRFALATAQIALSMLLLVLAGLFTQSLAHVARTDIGLHTDSLVTFGIAPQLNGYTAEQSAQLFDRLEQELAAQPGVTAVVSSAVELLSNGAWRSTVRVEGFEATPGERNDADMNFVGAGFFKTFDVPLLGRDFTAQDAADRPPVAIVNQRFTERYGLGDHAIGKRLSTRDDGPLDVEIVGVFADTAYESVKEPVRPQVLIPHWQSKSALGFATFYVRSTRTTDDMLATIRRTVATIDANLPPTNLRTVDQQIKENVVVDRVLTILAAALALVATLLAALGLYGVLSYTVAQRTREIGLRLALGAEPARVRGMMLRQVAWMAGVGAPLGLLAALALGRLAHALLFGLSPADPLAFGAAAVVLAAVVFGASYLPARRASHVDPVVALRSE